MHELLPACEREAAYMREIITQVEELERILSPRDLGDEGTPAAFASLDEAERYLEIAQSEADGRPPARIPASWLR